MDVQSAKLRRIGRIGQKITQWREKQAQISMEALAAKIDRSLSTIQRWERGVIEPKVSDLQAMDRVNPGLPELLFPRLAK
jgi:ribosome-binding protein aMBF1 (putative translation factor)